MRFRQQFQFIEFSIFLLWLSISAPLAYAEVHAMQDSRKIIMDNGLIALEISRAVGTITSIQYKKAERTYQIASGPEAMYWDANADIAGNSAQQGDSKGYYRPGVSRESCELVVDTPERAEAAVRCKPVSWFPFQVEYRFVLIPGTSGYYSYVIFRHSSSLPAATLWQTRFVNKLNLKDQFDTWVVDDDQISAIPTAAVLGQLMDATFLLDDGSIKTKYANSVYWDRAMVYGVVGKEIGIWSISASPEYHNGGPVKQGQTVHDNVLLRVLQSSHFGASGVSIKAGERWEKVYGPVFTYINSGTSVQAMWSDAKNMQRAEASKWPYDWVTETAYVHERGGISGRWKLLDQTATQGAWVILAEPGGEWPLQGKGYMFWARTDPDGKFKIANVVPGTYTMYIVGADQPEQYSRDGVLIVKGQTTELGNVDWKPITHGKKIWQIGLFDRSAAEFRNGDDSRHYEMFRRYPEQFPDDITFLIGKSVERNDWNYAHWTWYSKSSAWKIRFNLLEVPAGKATLTIGIASAQPLDGKLTDLRVGVNGKEVGAVRLPKTGTAGYRGGSQDSSYNVQYLQFDSSLFQVGDNELTLRHQNAEPFPKLEERVDSHIGQLMYDAIRLEIAPFR